MRMSHRWMLRGIAILALSASAVVGSAAAVETTFSVQGLRCEYLSNPLGIDVQKPRLSWMLTPAAGISRSERLSCAGCEYLRRILQKDQGDLWDSGRVASGQSTWIEYGGKKLGSGQQAYWKVRVWSDAGKGIVLERAGHVVDGPSAIVGLAREMDRRTASRWSRSEGTPLAVSLAAEDVYPGSEDRPEPWPMSIRSATTSCTSMAGRSMTTS